MTPRRYRRIRAVLDQRQPDLTVVLDDVNKPHNLAAILRSCDAVGVLEAHAVTPRADLEPDDSTAAGRAKWVALHRHARLEEAYDQLAVQGMQTVVAHPAPEAVDFREIDYTRPTALVMGAEWNGPSEATHRRADHYITVPMAGMVASLNVSVAAAVILFEAQRQREAVGLYDGPCLGEAICQQLLFRWGHPYLARWCDTRGLPYPRVGEDGELLNPLPRRDEAAG